MQQFSTDNVAPSHRFSYWKEAVCASFVPLEVECDAQATFRSELQLRPVAGFDLITVRGSTQQVRRSHRLIDADDSECLIVMAQAQGDGVASQGDNEAWLRPGSLTLLDSRRPYTLAFPGNFEQAVLKVPLAQLERRGAVGWTRRAPPLRTDSRLCALAHHAISALAVERAAVSALVLGSVALDLLVLALGEASDATIEPAPRMHTLRVTWAQAHIASSLSDPTLSPAQVARAQGVSLRLLQRLFARQGMQLAEVIAEQRLLRCRAILQDPAQAGRPITDIALAWGFNDPGHFAKAFRRRFGHSPSEARASA